MIRRYRNNCMGRGYDDNPRRAYDDNPRKKGHSDLVDVERLAIMFGIPTFDEAWSEDADWEAQKYGEEEALENGASEENAQEAGFAAERASQDERYHQWHDAVTSAVEHEFSEHGLTLVPRIGEGRSSRELPALRRYPWEYRVVPTTSWMDAARKIMMTINGVGQFEFRNVREFLESGPWTAREAVLTHLHWMKDRAEVYGDKSALGRYERALR